MAKLNKSTDFFFFPREARNLDFFFKKVLAQILKLALWEQIKHVKVDYGPGTISLQPLVQTFSCYMKFCLLSGIVRVTWNLLCIQLNNNRNECHSQSGAMLQREK